MVLQERTVKTQLITELNDYLKKITNKDITPDEFDILYDADISDVKSLMERVKRRVAVIQGLSEMVAIMNEIAPLPADDQTQKGE
jgi:hypothetical protein